MNDTYRLTPQQPRMVLIGLLCWLAIAAAVGLSGLFYGVPAPVIGGTNVMLITLTLLVVFFNMPVRAWAMTVPLRVFVLYHTVRFVGIAFLVLYVNGSIPGAFAITAGWGDIAVAATALVVTFTALPISNRRRWWVVWAWNVFGLLDILIVLVNGMRLGLADLEQMAWITEFPMSLLPTFIVPLVIVTHILIFIRLWKIREDV